MPYDDFELVRTKDGHVLKTPDATYRLDAEALYKLAEIGLECRNWHGLARPPAGPLCVSVDLPYSDLSADQSTPHYSVRVLVPREIADEVVSVFTAELSRTCNFRWVSVWVAQHTYEDVDHPDSASTVDDARSILRSAMLGHQSDSIEGDIGYWRACGFTQDDAEALKALDLYDKCDYEPDFDHDDLRAKVRKDLLGTEEEVDEDDLELFEKFKLWLSGADTVDIVSAKASK